ncbi:MAG: hypothetical protein HY996_07740 [Micrococcales bacterium]|nr:hypothetical protein [Micrococcales bacterium]
MSAIDPVVPDLPGFLMTPPRAAVSAVNARPTGTVQWRSVTRDEWVGREGRSAVGTVRRLGADYLAIDSSGMLVGFFSSLAEAESSLIASREHRRPARVAAAAAAVVGIAALVVGILGLVVLGI